MSDGALATVLIAMIGGAIRVSTPFMFVALGETITEKSGRINLGLEGTLVLGAMVAYMTSYRTGSPWLGVLGAGGVGMALGAMHGYVCKLPRVNDVAIGIAMMSFGVGLAFFFGKPYIQPTAPRLPSVPIGEWLGVTAGIAAGAGRQPAVPGRPGDGRVPGVGLPQHALGPDPAHHRRQRAGRARDGHLGRLVRFLATAAGGFLAGIAGAFLSLYYPGSWNEGLSSGQGLMAVALVIFARWDPLQCVVAALLFGAAGALGPALQSIGVTQGYYFFNAAPYILTLLIMVASAGSKRAMRDVPGELSMTR